ncbi:MAG: hypothetical protein EAZ09_01095 [Oscillatoriales cyanobacterium]|nr:MAG: hypothetical protein EAZ18_14325 [Oscillatoriales cyanobacterium]TAH26234.1 MAG: hypothetical protein EAZ09_01095 [Oscillatoriales cyanobacterium]
MKTLLSVRQGTRTDIVRDTPRAFGTGILGSPTQAAFNSLQNQTQLLHLPKRCASYKEASFPVSLGTVSYFRYLTIRVTAFILR